MMKRAKRDRFSRAHSKGFHAAITGKSKSSCPYTSPDIKEQWLGGWREGRGEVSRGYFV